MLTFAHARTDLTFWINRAKANRAGLVPISLRITVRGTRAEVSTGIRCRPEAWDLATKRLHTVVWDEKRQCYARAFRIGEAAVQFNAALNTLEAKARLTATNLQADPEAPFSAVVIRNALVPRKPVPPLCVLALLAKGLETYTNLFTRATGATALRALQRHRAPLKSWPLPDLTPAQLANFSQALVDVSGPSRAGRCLDTLRALFGRACPGCPNPFAVAAKARRAQPALKPRYVLSRVELASLAALELPAGGLPAVARDIYMAQYYLHGSRVGVVLQLDWEQVDWKNGRVRFKAEKGGDWHNVQLRPQLTELLRAYWPGLDAAGPVFPLLPSDFTSRPAAERHRLRKSANSRVWKGLQVCAGLLALPGRLHSHTARHTLATHTVEVTGSYGVAQRFLGHRTQAMTERYVRPMMACELDLAADAVYGLPAIAPVVPPAPNSGGQVVKMWRVAAMGLRTNAGREVSQP